MSTAEKTIELGLPTVPRMRKPREVIEAAAPTGPKKYCWQPPRLLRRC